MFCQKKKYFHEIMFFFFCVPSHARSLVQNTRGTLPPRYQGKQNLCAETPKLIRLTPKSILLKKKYFHEIIFFFCVPGHARSLVRWVRQRMRSTAVSRLVPKASCGHPSDWAMSGVSKHQRWGWTAGCGWGFEHLCCIDIRLNGKSSVCGGGRGVDSIQFSV